MEGKKEEKKKEFSLWVLSVFVGMNITLILTIFLIYIYYTYLYYYFTVLQIENHVNQFQIPALAIKSEDISLISSQKTDWWAICLESNGFQPP